MVGNFIDGALYDQVVDIDERSLATKREAMQCHRRKDGNCRPVKKAMDSSRAMQDLEHARTSMLDSQTLRISLVCLFGALLPRTAPLCQEPNTHSWLRIDSSKLDLLTNGAKVLKGHHKLVQILVKKMILGASHSKTENKLRIHPTTPN